MEIEWDNVVRKVVEGSLPFPMSCVRGIERKTVLNWSTVPEVKYGDLSILLEIRKAVKEVIRENEIKRVGVWLSGGIDSSLLVAIASEILGPENVTAYSLAFETSDESRWAQLTADYGMQNHSRGNEFRG